MKQFIFISLMSFFVLSAATAAQIKYLKVSKGDRRLELIDMNEQVVRSYKIMLGRNPVGHKVQSGDFKTPEGQYLLDYKNPESKFHKSIHISYPNKADIKRARKLGVNPGGDIMIHGLPNDFQEMRDWLSTIGLQDAPEIIIRAALPQFDWTSGCIAVLDDEMDEIYSLVKVPTPITIVP